MADKKRARTRRAWDLPADVVYTVARLRIRDGVKPTEIVRRMRDERNVTIGREQVYSIINEACIRGYIELHCPLELDAASALAEAYRISPAADVSAAPPIQVVNAPAAEAREEAARHAAATACRLIMEIAARKGASERVHVAFASGSTTHLVLRHLADRIREQPEAFPKLTLHAASPGVSVSRPEAAAVTSFGLFRDFPGVECVAFHSAPIVRADLYEEHKALPGLSEPFARAGEVDLLITSIGSADDEDGEIRRLFTRSAPAETAGATPTTAGTGEHGARPSFDKCGGNFLAGMDARGWRGDVQYQLFNADGPIDTGMDYRAVTLFSIPDLVALAAKPNKAVLLVCGPRVKYQHSRSEALVPLLQSPKLRVWSHLVVDLRTADECTRMASASRRPADRAAAWFRSAPDS